MFRLFTLAALSVAALCFLPESRATAAEPAKAGCTCPGVCACLSGDCPSECTAQRWVLALDGKRKFWILRAPNQGGFSVDTDLIFGAAADNKFAAPCPNGKCPAQAGKAAPASGSCAPAMVTKGSRGFPHPVRNAIRAIRGR